VANFILRRILYSILLPILSATMIFFIVHAAPGSPFSRMINEILELHPNLRIPETHWARLNALLGLDQPLPIQYLHWLRGIFIGDLDDSWSIGSGLTLVWPGRKSPARRAAFCSTGSGISFCQLLC
jgi:peptide/nickel transport system permease protein